MASSVSSRRAVRANLFRQTRTRAAKQTSSESVGLIPFFPHKNKSAFTKERDAPQTQSGKHKTKLRTEKLLLGYEDSPDSVKRDSSEESREKQIAFKG
jgi:hypothetical protein